MTTKNRILVPFILTAVALSYCWITLIVNQYIPSWKHYAALVGLLLIAFISVKKVSKALIPLGVFLLLASFHVISLSYNQSVIGFGRDSPYNPNLQLMSLGIFVLYAALNLDAIIEWDLDRKERRVGGK